LFEVTLYQSMNITLRVLHRRTDQSLRLVGPIAPTTKRGFASSLLSSGYPIHINCNLHNCPVKYALWVSKIINIYSFVYMAELSTNTLQRTSSHSCPFSETFKAEKGLNTKIYQSRNRRADPHHKAFYNNNNVDKKTRKSLVHKYTATQFTNTDIEFQKKKLVDQMSPFSITSCIIQHTPKYSHTQQN
jgi:hypothetical protein